MPRKRLAVGSRGSHSRGWGQMGLYICLWQVQRWISNGHRMPDRHRVMSGLGFTGDTRCCWPFSEQCLLPTGPRDLKS